MAKRKHIVAGFDMGGAHLKVTRAEGGRIVAAATIASPLWQGFDRLAAAFREAEPIYRDSGLNAFTMTAELADIFRRATAESRRCSARSASGSRLTRP